MASRPVFIPSYEGPRLVEERDFDFFWSSGFAEVQKRKNIEALHDAAQKRGIKNILEISTKSQDRIGQRLSAFSLKLEINGRKYPLESVYQGSKVFESCGPFDDIFVLPPRDAKRFIRELDCGNLTGFQLFGRGFPLSPKNGFYDWLYIRALADHSEWIAGNVDYEAFTDIEFNPARQVNCQARAFAEFLSLLKRSKLKTAVENFDEFAGMLNTI